MKDNAAAHKTFQEIEKNSQTEQVINVFTWLAHSPDMNKIETPWRNIKYKVACYWFEDSSAKTVEEAEKKLE